MYIKRLAENLVQKALLLFEILSFKVYCRSDSDSPTLRINDTRCRRLSVSTIRGVGDSPYREVVFQKAYYFVRYKVLKFIVDQIATSRLADTGSQRLPDSPIRGVGDSPLLIDTTESRFLVPGSLVLWFLGIDSWAP